MVLFLDTNVPIYAAGTEHPLKAPCLRILGLVARHRTSFVTDAEVLQEILHRYLSLNRRDQGLRLVREFSVTMAGRVEPVYANDVVSAADLSRGDPSLSARDLIHLAVMKRLAVTEIVSADKALGETAGMQRLDPGDVHRWAAQRGLE